MVSVVDKVANLQYSTRFFGQMPLVDGGVLLHCEQHETRTYLHEIVDCDLVVGTFLHPPARPPPSAFHTPSYTLHPVPSTLHLDCKSKTPNLQSATQASRDSTRSGRAFSTTKVWSCAWKLSGQEL